MLILYHLSTVYLMHPRHAKFTSGPQNGNLKGKISPHLEVYLLLCRQQARGDHKNSCVHAMPPNIVFSAFTLAACRQPRQGSERGTICRGARPGMCCRCSHPPNPTRCGLCPGTVCGLQTLSPMSLSTDQAPI